jgi:serine/threonine-protein kinase RsbW
VRTAAEAQFALSSRKIDVILTQYDLSLHCHGIFEAAFDQYPIRVVLMATPADFDAMGGCPPAYVDQCVEKPVSRSKLMAAIEIAMASHTRRLIHLANSFGRSAGVLLTEELPRHLPGFNLEILSGTATYGGGDFGLALPGEGFTRLVLADIMGHGLKAKAGAIALSSILRTLHRQKAVSAGAFLEGISDVMGDEPTFADIICTIMVVDAREDGAIEAACAGHPPVAIVSPRKCCVLPVTGPLPGLLKRPRYPAVRYRMEPGDKIAIITDGIDSQSAATGDFPERLLDELAKHPSRSLGALKEDMERWLDRRLGPAPKDDWTLMIGEFCGAPAQKAQAFPRLEAQALAEC